MKRLTFIFLSCALLLTLAGCGGRQVDAPEAATADAPDAPVEEPDTGYHYLPKASDEDKPDAGLSEEERALREAAERAERLAKQEARLRGIVEGMTLEEKVGQLFFVRCLFTGMEEQIARYHLGGVLLFTQDYKDSADNWLSRDDFIAKLEGYQAAAGDIPLFIGSDEEGGTVTRASRNPNLFPSKSRSPQELYSSGGLGAILNDAAQKSQLLCGIGVNVNFAPVADVSTDPKDFIYDRALGRNAADTMAYVAGVVSVMRDTGVGSVLKHFPGYGNNADTHTGVAIDERPVETFQKSDCLPFVGGIRAGAPFVLVSHNVVTSMDAHFPASLSPAVHELLRGELGFEGVILTDDLAMDAVKSYARDGGVAVLALQAGNDMVVTTDFAAQIEQVLAAVGDGALDESLIDAACLRVLRAKQTLGLLELED